MIGHSFGGSSNSVQRSWERILTTHAGSLPRPADLLALNQARARGEAIDPYAHAGRLREAVAEVVRHQADVGVDVVDDGEFGKPNFLNYAQERLTSFEPDPTQTGDSVFFRRRDFVRFSDFYHELYAGRSDFGRQPVCTAQVTYRGHAALQTDLDNFKAALQGGDTPAFLPAIAPGTFGRGQNRYYATEEEFLFAIAEAMRQEYQAIVDAGFVLQIDDPGLPDTWDLVLPELSVEDYRKYAMVRIDALNHALRGLPEDRIRYHICWGSWHGPHTTDIPLEAIVDLLLKVSAGAYSLEAANVRHELDWKVWREVKLPDDKLLIPGVVSHATNIVEDPELVADRIVRYAGLVGRERVIAGTDCGLGGRVHPQIAWAKLQALSQGAAIASQQLWSKGIARK